MEQLPPRDPTPWETTLNGADPDEIDFISKMLTWDPRKRITIQEALEHPFLDEYHDPSEEPDALPLSNFDFEKTVLGIDDIKRLLWQEIRRYHPDFPPC